MRIAVLALGLLVSILLLLPLVPHHASAGQLGGSKSQKVIDFDDETIEGLNKRPLDSLSQISDKDKRKRKPHLYRKRGGFRTETAESLRVLRYTQ